MTTTVAAAAPHGGDRYLTTEEVAGVMRISPRTLERLREKGTGPEFMKVGPSKRARVLYLESSVSAHLNSFRYRSTSDYDA